MLPLTSTQQLQQLQQDLPSHTWPQRSTEEEASHLQTADEHSRPIQGQLVVEPLAQPSAYSAHLTREDTCSSSEGLSAQPPLEQEAPYTALPSVSLPDLPEDPFSQSLPSQTAAATQPRRTSPLPADLFCQETIPSTQSLLSTDRRPDQLHPDLTPQSAVNAAEASRISDLSSQASVSAQHALGTSGVTSTSAAALRKPGQDSSTSCTASQPSRHLAQLLGAASGSLQHTALSTPAGTGHASSTPSKAVASAQALSQTASNAADAKEALTVSQYGPMIEANLRGSLVEWLADAVASRLATVLQGTTAAGTVTVTAAQHHPEVDQAATSAAMSGATAYVCAADDFSVRIL